MSRNSLVYKHLDWYIIICYVLLVFFGWLNITASCYNINSTNILDIGQKSGAQLLWIGIGFLIASALVVSINPKFYIGLSFWLYVGVLGLLAVVLILGKEINGSKSWFILGPVSFQPSEISKITTALILAVVMSRPEFKLTRRTDFLQAFTVVLLPIALIALEPDMGTILVYCSLIFVFYREGMSGLVIVFFFFLALLFIITLKYSALVSILLAFNIIWILKSLNEKNTFFNILFSTALSAGLIFLPKVLEIPAITKIIPFDIKYIAAIIISIIGLREIFIALKNRLKERLHLAIILFASLALIFSVEFIFNNVLKEHHRDRIENLLGIEKDLQGTGYNVNQSMIAIGSGGFTGKGFLQGTQTKFKFVPEQSTDFIFCTIGEEWGFVGSILVLILYLIIIIRLVILSERQQDRLNRVYGYCVASYFFTHVVVNIGMTIGIMPVVGIPLPFISYGGSSFITFTVMLFIFLRMDLERWKY